MYIGTFQPENCTGMWFITSMWFIISIINFHNPAILEIRNIFSLFTYLTPPPLPLFRLFLFIPSFVLASVVHKSRF